MFYFSFGIIYFILCTCKHLRRRLACESLKPDQCLWFLINSSINNLSYYIERFLEGRLRIFNAYSFDSYCQLALLESAKEGTSSQRKTVPDTKVSWSACYLNGHAIAFRIPLSLCHLLAVNCLYVHLFSVWFF